MPLSLAALSAAKMVRNSTSDTDATAISRKKSVVQRVCASSAIGQMTDKEMEKLIRVNSAAGEYAEELRRCRATHHL